MVKASPAKASEMLRVGASRELDGGIADVCRGAILLAVDGGGRCRVGDGKRAGGSFEVKVEESLPCDADNASTCV